MRAFSFMNVSAIAVEGMERREEPAKKVVAGVTKERRHNKSRSQKRFDDFLSLITSVWRMKNGFIHRPGSTAHGWDFFSKQSSLWNFKCPLAHLIPFNGHQAS